MGMVRPKIPFQKWFQSISVKYQQSRCTVHIDDRFVNDLIEPEVKTVDCEYLRSKTKQTAYSSGCYQTLTTSTK